MAGIRLGAALRQIHGLFEAGTVAGLTDGQLLERYITRRDESAFAALVMRHGPMVLGVCHSILHGVAEVEDAFQATFLLLIRKAGTIRGRDAVGGWLHRVAHWVAVQAGRDRSRTTAAARARRTARPRRRPRGARRRRLARPDHEELRDCPSDSAARSCSATWKEDPAQAAVELAWSEATLRRRLADARDLLHGRLTREASRCPPPCWPPL